MHRNLSDLTARLDRALAQRLLPCVHAQRTPIEVRVAHLPGEPLPFAQAVELPFEPAEVGAPWGRPWSTSWFRLRGTVPQSMAGRRVELLVDLGFSGGGPGFEAEGLVYATDGRPLKGIEPRNTAVAIADAARGGEPVDLFVEAAANPSIHGFAPSPLGDPLTLPTEPLYRLARAELAVLDERVQALVLDVQVLHELAEELAEADPRRHEIRAALARMLDALDTSDVAAGAAAARASLAGVLACPATTSAHRISAVGHAHIDSAWMWPVRETVRKCARTFSNVVTLADQYPDLVFACSSAQQYAWMKQRYPHVYRRIREKVASGQFVPVGGMWVESDTNLPGGESLVRQLVAGRRFFAREFGVETPEVWLPDSFGYSGALPQLARLAGARWMLSQKMSWNRTNRFPHHTFWWEGIDGSRVFTHFPPADTYSAKLSGAQLAFGVRNFAELGGATRSLLPFGYGDGGGGPTREMMEIAHRVADLEGSPRVAIEPPAAFFSAAEAEYGAGAPVWTGEMYLEFHRGTYTSQLAMKQGNRRAEGLLREAELWAATAAVRIERPYPYAQLERIWQDTLLLQFHDILPGSSITWVHREAREAYARLAEELDEIIAGAQDALAGRGDLPLVFNSRPHAAHGVPALGAAPTTAASGTVDVRRDATGIVLDNGLVRVRVAEDGTVAQVRDLVAEREVLAPSTRANVLALHPDQPVRFDAWDIDEYYRRRVRELRALDELTVDRSDPARPSVTVVRTDGGSRYVQTIAVGAGARRVDFALDVDWRERETLCKTGFVLDVHAERSSSETQFGHVHRATHTNTSWDAARFEICAHRWIHVGEPGYGVAIVNDSTYGHDVTRPGPGDARGAGPTQVRLSLLRSPLFPDPETDQGHHTLRYALVPGASIPDAIREGYSINLPTHTRPGAAPVAPLVAVSPGSCLVEAVKLADDESGDVVVRLYESTGGRCRARVRPSFPAAGVQVVDLLERADPEVAALAPVTVDADGVVDVPLGPFQVVTLRFARA